MKTFGSMTLRMAAVAVLACLCTSFGQSQDPKEKPTYGTKDVKAGFEPDPMVLELKAGGPVETNEGGFKHYVAKEPDLRVNYTAGKFPLTFFVESQADTTLLINLPNGKWIANDDGPGTGLNPLIKLTDPPSGQYDIWVGTIVGGKLEPAKLFITELK